ncbi:MAG TPA: type I phosphomannose isomerase catalytic subunit [Caulobacteraceae bacterium]|jgi:mannose-6-phosphate isomerase
MTDTSLYPLGFEPMFQYRLWGGRELGQFMNTALPGSDPIGEAWLLSDREDCASRIANGPLAGKTLTDLMRERKAELLGAQADRFDRFPLLLKFLDVEEMLSVQVHPDDDQIELIPKGDTGKTEAWIVLSAKPNARIYAGLKPGTTAEDLRGLTAADADRRLASFQPVPGQAVKIEAGTVHSLGDGLMVFEVQENSDVTFRLYDWDHVDAKTGKPRPLQIDEALAAIDFDRGAVAPVEPQLQTSEPIRAEKLIHDAHFDVVRRKGSRPFPVGAASEFRVLVCIEGGGDVEAGAQRVSMSRGKVVLLPAAIGVGSFIPKESATILEIAVPVRT